MYFAGVFIKMSQLQKLKAKQNKIKIGFTFEKTVNGVEITIKSQKLGGLLRTFYNKYNGIDEFDNRDQAINPYWIIRSLDFSDYYQRHSLIHGSVINIEFLKGLFSERKTTITHKIDNVFTNDEIKSFIINLETYLIKVKQLNIESKIEVLLE